MDRNDLLYAFGCGMGYYLGVDNNICETEGKVSCHMILSIIFINLSRISKHFILSNRKR